jgi:hypothetical protein
MSYDGRFTKGESKPTCSNWTYVAKSEFFKCIFTLDKSRDSQLWYIIHCMFEEQWERNSALKVDKLVNSLLRKWPLNVLVPTGAMIPMIWYLLKGEEGKEMRQQV